MLRTFLEKNRFNNYFFRKLQSRKALKFRIRPENLDDGVVLYVAESEKAYGDFFAVILKNGHIELRYNVGGSKRIINWSKHQNLF